jgi:hypothetical protein
MVKYLLDTKSEKIDTDYQKFLKDNSDILMIDAYAKLFVIYPEDSVDQLDKRFKLALDRYIKESK